MSFTFDCYSVISDHKYQQHFAPRQVFQEMQTRSKDTLLERFHIFLELLTYIKSLNINEYELFDGNQIFDINRFNNDCTIALGYINNDKIVRGKFLSLLENIWYEFSQIINEDSDYTIIPEIYNGTRPASDFINLNETIEEKKVNYVYTGKSGDKHIWQGKAYFQFPEDKILDILHGPDISEDTRIMFDYYLNNIEDIKKTFKQSIFVLREVIRFEFDKTAKTKTALYIKEKVFPDSQALAEVTDSDENPGF